MEPLRNRVLTQVDRARRWLDEAQEAYEDGAAVRGDKNINLAAAELRIALEKSQFWQRQKEMDKKKKKSGGALPVVAMLTVILMLGGGVFSLFMMMQPASLAEVRLPESGSVQLRIMGEESARVAFTADDESNKRTVYEGNREPFYENRRWPEFQKVEITGSLDYSFVGYD